MKKILWIISILFGILMITIIGIIVSRNKLISNNIPFTKKPTITINDHTFMLHVANTTKDKEIGLSKFDKLRQDFGMLFTFEKPGYYSFWMKNMKFPIDIIFINDDRIVTIYKNVPPAKSKNENLLIYQPKSAADKVLEIEARLSEKYNIKEGDIVKLKNL